ncbi:S8 family serine peptidase [Paractinoplanes maris]|uniref:S8 family serine peptidase n=1 Tax=Paractinoplanes maris TaxID=1734446 RepID=UPI00202017FD|nr:S8 family serine peptidase [Actinoplanes maris]
MTVAVLDSGIYPHPDIKKNLLAGSDQASRSNKDGRSDTDGHGTRMAALIAGHGRGSNQGIQGIAPAAKVLPVIITSDGRGHADIMARGVAWASSQKAQIINISGVAGPGFELQDAVETALAADIVIVAAAGNTSSDAIINYPAAFDGVLAVGATGRNGKYSPSSVKDEKVQICAPGVDIISAQPPNDYGSATGTSDSTAIVSGAAALIRAQFPQLSARDVVHRLTATADDIGPPGRDNECGFGRLNIVRALTAKVSPIEDDQAAPEKPTATTSAPSVIRPEIVVPSSPPQAEGKPASNTTFLLFGGLAGAVAIAGALVAFALRQRRRP